ncbi:hypothetical protein KKH43_01185 [Patescibacteria group bacterium]|nr:hypothetical protein [Patescibacteria group bacterium]
MKTINYYETPEFKKGFKKLLKKYKTLEEDFKLVKKATIELFHVQEINNTSVFRVSGHYSEDVQIFIIKKFACKALKGRGAKSGIRVIYALHVQKYRVDFIEMYFKGTKENEDRVRIKMYLKDFFMKTTK